MTTSRIPAPLVAEPSLSETARRVLDVLRKRRTQYDQGMSSVLSPAVTRLELRAATKSPDRTIRDAVRELRVAAHPVVSDSGVRGYWLSDDPQEIRECAERTYLGRIRHHAAASKGLMRAAATVAARPERQGTLRGVLG